MVRESPLSIWKSACQAAVNRSFRGSMFHSQMACSATATAISRRASAVRKRVSRAFCSLMSMTVPTQPLTSPPSRNGARFERTQMVSPEARVTRYSTVRGCTSVACSRSHAVTRARSSGCTWSRQPVTNACIECPKMRSSAGLP